MKIASAHVKDPLMGWDLNVSVNAEASEKISQVTVYVNGFPEEPDSLDPPVVSYTRQLMQKGQFPGTNRVRVAVIDDKGNRSDGYDTWS